MTETEHPFDPALPGHVRDYVEAWKQTPHRGSRPEVIASFFSARDGYHELTEAHLTELLDRLADREKNVEQLAETSGRYRSERNEARTVALSLLAFMRVAMMNNEEIAAILSCSPSELPTWFPSSDAEAAV